MEAIELFEQALTDLKKTRIAVALARTRWQAGEQEAALTALEDWIARNPTDTQGYESTNAAVFPTNGLDRGDERQGDCDALERFWTGLAGFCDPFAFCGCKELALHRTRSPAGFGVGFPTRRLFPVCTLPAIPKPKCPTEQADVNRCFHVKTLGDLTGRLRSGRERARRVQNCP